MVLNSVANVGKAQTVLPDYSVIACYLDNDEAGLNAASRIHKALQQKGFENVEYDISAHKDWNEQLKASCSEEQEAQDMLMA